MKLLLAFFILISTAGFAVELSFVPDSIQIDEGETATLSIIIDQPTEIRTIELVITFDPELVQSNYGYAGQLFSDAGCFVFEDFNDNDPGQWHGSAVLIGSECWIDSVGELYVWNFTGLADGVSPIIAAEVYLYSPDASLIDQVLLTSAQVVHDTQYSFGSIKTMFK
jgi:hypothetical protein